MTWREEDEPLKKENKKLIKKNIIKKKKYC